MHVYHLSFCMHVCLSACLHVCLLVCLSVCMHVCLSVDIDIILKLCQLALSLFYFVSSEYLHCAIMTFGNVIVSWVINLHLCCYENIYVKYLIFYSCSVGCHPSFYCYEDVKVAFEYNSSQR